MVLRTESPDETTCVEKDLNGYVGFANLPNQVFRKSVKRGFEFTLMVVGATGLGKSTLINSLFLSSIYEDERYPTGTDAKLPQTVQVQNSTVYLVEGGVSLKLTLVDTPGFGDAINNTKCWKPILEYIDNKFEEYLNAEGHVNRSTVVDNRVHCCLYFISPGHGLKPLDIEFMKQLHEKVNIVPVIGKADTLTPEECTEFKANVMEEIERNDIKIYQFPVDEFEDEEEVQDLQAQLPFAVVGSNTMLDINGKKLRGRMYPWGIAEVENPDHCDFIFLRNLLIRTHMQDLKDVTNNQLYENYRCQKLAAVTSVSLDSKLAASNRNPLAQFEMEKKEHQARLKNMKAGMEKVMEEKVKEKMNKMEEQKNELKQKHEQALKHLEKMRSDLELKKKELAEQTKTLEELQLASGVPVNNSTSSLNSAKEKTQSKKNKSTKKLF